MQVRQLGLQLCLLGLQLCLPLLGRLQDCVFGLLCAFELLTTRARRPLPDALALLAELRSAHNGRATYPYDGKLAKPSQGQVLSRCFFAGPARRRPLALLFRLPGTACLSVEIVAEVRFDCRCPTLVVLQPSLTLAPRNLSAYWEGGHRVRLLMRWTGRIEPGSTSIQLVSLTDIFATSLDAIGANVPATGAEDSISFLGATFGRSPESARTSLVSDLNQGEFAYRDGPWKLVYRRSDPSLENSRGQSTIAELYNLESDIAEEHDLAAENPEMAEELKRRFDEVIARGASRPGVESANDAAIRYEITQTERWAPPAP